MQPDIKTEYPRLELQLHFVSGTSSVELEKTGCFDPYSGFLRTAFRAKSSTSGRTTFRWTTAVQGLALLLVKAAYYQCKGADPSGATLEGNKDSLAASLDYALSKQPAWMHEMFGANAGGDALVRDWIVKINAGRRRPGPVILSLNTARLGPNCIQIFLDGIAVKDIWAFRAVISGLHLSSTTELPEENVIIKRHQHNIDSPFSSAVIQPAERDDIEHIHAYECVEFPESHATFARLLEWRNHEPDHFSVLKYSREEFLAYYILLFPKPESLRAFLRGDLKEDELGTEHLIAPTNNAYLSCGAAHICAVAWKKGAAFFGMDLFWHLIERITYLATHGVLSELYAEVPTSERELIATQFGFKREPDRPGREPLFKITLTPMVLKQWETNIRARSPHKQHIALSGV